MDKHSLVLYFMSLLFMTTALKIRDILVPQTITLPPKGEADNEGVILDCDYDVENDTSNLVLKWFHDEQPVYQWITPFMPQAIGPLKDRVDLTYRASRHELTQYRAMRIKELSRDLAGVYKCVVFTFQTEDQMSKRMIVVNKPTKLEMLQLEAEEDDMFSIACSAFDVYPKPVVNISFGDSSDFYNIDNQSMENDDGLFNVTQIVTVKSEMLANVTDFVCTLSIPDTDYFMERRLRFFSGFLATQFQSEMNNFNAPRSESTYTKDKASMMTSTWLLLLPLLIGIFLSP